MILKIFTFFIILHGLGIANDWINENIELTINGKFNRAISLLENRINEDSTDYKAYFYLAATYNSKMTHFENYEYEFDFFDAIDRAIKLVQKKKPVIKWLKY